MAQRQLITAETVRQARNMGLTQIGVQPGAIVTWQARDDAARLGVILTPEAVPAASAGKPSVETVLRAAPHNEGAARFGGSIPAWASVPLTTLPPVCKSAPVVAPVASGVSVSEASVVPMSAPAASIPMPAGPAVTAPVCPAPAAVQPVQAAGSDPSGAMMALARAFVAGFGAEQLQQLGQAFLTLAEQARNLGQASCATEQSSQQQVSGMQENQPLVQASSFGLPFVIQPAVPTGAPSFQNAPVAQPAESCTKPAIDLNTEDIFSAVREQVLAKVPAGTDPAIIDGMIRKALTEQGPGCGGSCVRCIKAASQSCGAAAAAAPQTGSAWLQKTASVARVNSQALPLAQNGAGVGMMEVISPDGSSEMPAVGYVEWERGAFPWTFARAEALVVLEGELTVRADGQVLTAGPGDVCAFEKGAQVTFETHGRVRYAAVAPAVRG